MSSQKKTIFLKKKSTIFVIDLFVVILVDPLVTERARDISTELLYWDFLYGDSPSNLWTQVNSLIYRKKRIFRRKKNFKTKFKYQENI